MPGPGPALPEFDRWELEALSAGGHEASRHSFHCDAANAALEVSIPVFFQIRLKLTPRLSDTHTELFLTELIVQDPR